MEETWDKTKAKWLQSTEDSKRNNELELFLSIDVYFYLINYYKACVASTVLIQYVRNALRILRSLY